MIFSKPILYTIIFFLFLCIFFGIDLLKKDSSKEVNYDLSDEIMTISDCNRNLEEISKIYNFDKNALSIINKIEKKHYKFIELSGGYKLTAGHKINGRIMKPFKYSKYSKEIIESLNRELEMDMKVLNVNDPRLYKKIDGILNMFIVQDTSIYYLGNSNKNHLTISMNLLTINNFIYTVLLQDYLEKQQNVLPKIDSIENLE